MSRSRRKNRIRKEHHWPVRVRLSMNKEQSIHIRKGIKTQTFERLCQSCDPGNFKRERFLCYIPRNVSGGLWGQWRGKVSDRVPIMKSWEMQNLKQKWRKPYKKEKLLLQLYLEFSTKQTKNISTKNTFKYNQTWNYRWFFMTESITDGCKYN